MLILCSIILTWLLVYNFFVPQIALYLALCFCYVVIGCNIMAKQNFCGSEKKTGIANLKSALAGIGQSMTGRMSHS